MRPKFYKNWNPAALGNKVKSWHRADEKSITLSGSEIATLNNYGSLKGTFDQGTGANRFVISEMGDKVRNGMLADTNNYMDHSGPASDWAFMNDGYEPWYWAAAIQPNLLSSGIVFGTHNAGFPQTGVVIFFSGGSLKINMYNGSSTILDKSITLMLDVVSTIVIAISYSSDVPVCNVWVNNKKILTDSVGTNTVSTGSPTRTLRMGWAFSAFKGKYPEGIIATGTPSNDDVEKLHTYLRDRWHEWNPLDSESKLKLWLHADNGVTLTDGYVSAWNDLSASGFDAVQATAGKQPVVSTMTGGQTALSFDGTDDFLDLTGISVPSGKYTIALVAETTLLSRHLFDSLTGRIAIQTRITGTPNAPSYYDGAWHNIGIWTADKQSLIFQLDSATASRIIRDGTSLGTDTYADKAIGGATALGARYDGAANFWGGLLREFIIFSPALSEAELKKLFIYQARNSGTP